MRQASVALPTPRGPVSSQAWCSRPAGLGGEDGALGRLLPEERRGLARVRRRRVAVGLVGHSTGHPGAEVVAIWLNPKTGI